MEPFGPSSPGPLVAVNCKSALPNHVCVSAASCTSCNRCCNPLGAQSQTSDHNVRAVLTMPSAESAGGTGLSGKKGVIVDTPLATVGK